MPTDVGAAATREAGGRLVDVRAPILPRPIARLDTRLERLVQQAHRAGGQLVLATVVGTAHVAESQPGARAIIDLSHAGKGFRGGGRVETALRVHGRRIWTRHRAESLVLRSPPDEDDLLVLGEDWAGAARVLLEPANLNQGCMPILRNLVHSAQAGASGLLITLHRSSNLRLGTYDIHSALPPPIVCAARRLGAALPVFTQMFDGGSHGSTALFQYVAPLPHLLICGGGPDVEPVSSAAVRLGWRVTIAEHRSAYAVASRFPGAHVVLVRPSSLRSALSLEDCHAAVVMSHHLPSDVAYLRELAGSEQPGYIGLLGPSARRLRIAGELGDVMKSLQPRIRGPVGIDLGAVTPEGIALAIVTQIHGWLAGRESGG